MKKLYIILRGDLNSFKRLSNQEHLSLIYELYARWSYQGPLLMEWNSALMVESLSADRLDEHLDGVIISAVTNVRGTGLGPGPETHCMKGNRQS